jgi:hypothetical protein
MWNILVPFKMVFIMVTDSGIIALLLTTQVSSKS